VSKPRLDTAAAGLAGSPESYPGRTWYNTSPLDAPVAGEAAPASDL
jgi:hypothetical protein